eukprot:CAMPEP_0183600562 /NCGR_PEP_ID=MMETSP0371-20130417/180000_1 /TAXON_ID=268820 /ORGANISM="Peridinium aciculiferum, Strain PAER-2" /LENGTH=344 /DNA_ID=CAMNT_0025812643 /DNA_START=53 /DNA_END=1084 /DNA_ORIENTATION=-
MAKMAATVAFLAVPVAAFVPQGNLRSQPAEFSLRTADVQTGVGATAEAGTSQAAVGLIGLTVAGLAMSASRVCVRKQPKALRRNKFFDEGGITAVGVCAPFPDKFDPLKLGNTDAKMERNTVAEIKHGRVAMLATLGYVVPELFHFPGCTADVQTGVGATAEAGTSQAAVGLIGLTVAGLAMSASRVSARKQPKALRRNKFFDEGGITAVGVCAPFPDKFDPLKLGNTDAKMERNTVAEIKHGRVAMLATLGYVVPELFHFPGCEKFTNGLGALDTIPTEGWVSLFAFIGFHEIAVKPRVNGMGDYDLGFGSEFLENCDDTEIKRRQTAERNNGRLAMMAIFGM